MRSQTYGAKVKKIFVGGLPLDLEEQEFRDYFSNFGEVVEAVIMKNRDSNMSRGLAHCFFWSNDDLASLDSVLSHSAPRRRLTRCSPPHTVFMGKKLRLERQFPSRRLVMDPRHPSAVCDPNWSSQSNAHAEGPAYPRGGFGPAGYGGYTRAPQYTRGPPAYYAAGYRGGYGTTHVAVDR